MLTVSILNEDHWLEVADIAESPSFALAYRQDFVLKCARENLEFSICNSFPVRLMEVFEDDLIEPWLHLYKPLKAKQIRPELTFGNIRIESSGKPSTLVTQDCIIDYKNLFHEYPIVQHEALNSLRPLIGGFANQPFVFAKCGDGGLQSFSAHDLDANSELILIPLDVVTAAQRSKNSEEALKLCSMHSLFFSQLNGLLDLGELALQLDSERHFPLRPDWLLGSGRPEWCNVQHMAFLLPNSLSSSNDKMTITKKYVSTNLHKVMGFDSVEAWLIEYLKRDIIARLFFASSSGIENSVRMVNNRLIYLPILWSSRVDAEPKAQRMINDWPEYAFEDDHPDYALICSELSHLSDSSRVFFALTEFSEQLVAIIPQLLKQDPVYGERICQYYRLHSVSQTLMRWGLVL